jgi:hypothetical protein
MSSRLAAQICVIRAPEKLPDRLLLSGVIGNPSDKPLSEQFVFAYLFEITRPWLPSSQILPSLVTVLEEQHTHLDPKASLDDQFEQVLRAINQKLNEVSERGETDWIGNLNGLIVLLGKEEVHFSQTGRCPAYLLQNNRIRQITDDHVEQDPHPLKTFSNLASGHLQANDYLLIANLELYNEISLDALRRILNTNTPYGAAKDIARELKKERNSKISSIITAVKPAEEAKTSEPEVLDMADILESSTKKLSRKLIPFFHSAKTHSQEWGKAGAKMAQELGSASVKAAQQAQQVTKEKVLPKANALIAKGTEKLKQTSVGDTVPPPVIEIISPHTETIADIPLNEDEIAERPVGSVIPASEFAMEASSPTPPRSFPDTLRVIAFQTFPTLVQTSLRRFGVWIEVPKNKKTAALVVAIILVAATVWGALAERSHPNSTANASDTTTTLTMVQENTTKIATAIQLEQEVEASRLLTDSFTKLAALSNPISSQKDQAATLWKNLTAQADTLTKTTRFADTSSTYTFPGSTQFFFSSLPYFFGFQSNGNGILRTGNGTLADIQATFKLPSPDETILSISHSSEADTAGYLLTRQSKVYRIVQSGSSTLLRPIAPESGDFATGTIISSYSGNVYILDGGTSGLLWRYINSGTSYSKGSMFIDVNKVDLKNSLSMAIDGSIFILKQDGSVIKLNGGKQDTAFSLQKQPYLSQKLIRPLQIVTAEGFSSIFILDGGATSAEFSTAKIMEFDKNGTFIRQYAFPDSFTDVRSFDINPKDKKLWVLNGTTVSEFSL